MITKCWRHAWTPRVYRMTAIPVGGKVGQCGRGVTFRMVKVCANCHHR